MEITYEKIETELGSCIKMTNGEIVSFIPIDPANSDYQAYLKQSTENPTA